MLPQAPLTQEEINALINFHVYNNLYPFYFLAELSWFSDEPGKSLVYDITTDLDYAIKWLSPAAGRFFKRMECPEQ